MRLEVVRYRHKYPDAFSLVTNWEPNKGTGSFGGEGEKKKKKGISSAFCKPNAVGLMNSLTAAAMGIFLFLPLPAAAAADVAGEL